MRRYKLIKDYLFRTDKRLQAIEFLKEEASKAIEDAKFIKTIVENALKELGID
ncbi:MAG: hypothetical protein N2Z81_00185 [Hydrogenothermaceae bacterium]|nr:hypothetical protein [Hydrogenothermaceae bacterium]